MQPYSMPAPLAMRRWPRRITWPGQINYGSGVDTESAPVRPFTGFRAVRVVAVTYYSVFPLLSLPRLAADPAVPGRFAESVLFGLLVLPVTWWPLMEAARDRHTRSARWSLAALVVVLAGGTAVIGVDVLPAYPTLMILAVLYAPLPWSLPLFGLVWLASCALPFLTGNPQEFGFAFWNGLSAGAIGTAIFWLLLFYQRLLRARAELAESAVAQERVRIDVELEDSLGAALRDVLARAEDADRAAAIDPEGGARTLTELVGRSRDALDRTRHLVTRFRHDSLRTEIDNARRLLAAAGIDVRVELPAGLPVERTEALRAQLRAGLAEVLTRDDVRECVIVVDDDEPVRVTLHARGVR